MCGPTHIFHVPPFTMDHTHSEDLESCLSTLSYNFSETQHEVQKLSANVTTINAKMHSTIDTKMETLKQDLSAQLESFTSYLCTNMNIPRDLNSYDQDLQPEGETFSNSPTFLSHHFQRYLCLLRVDVKKIDGSDPTGRVTQMEHYFSLHGITYELDKLHYGVLHLDHE
jgi:hypothetical protein